MRFLDTLITLLERSTSHMRAHMHTWLRRASSAPASRPDACVEVDR